MEGLLQQLEAPSPSHTNGWPPAEQARGAESSSSGADEDEEGVEDVRAALVALLEREAGALRAAVAELRERRALLRALQAAGVGLIGAGAEARPEPELRQQ